MFKRLLCLLGFHDPLSTKFVPRRLERSVWDWFREENFDYECTRCQKTRYGSSGRWIKSERSVADG